MTTPTTLRDQLLIALNTSCTTHRDDVMDALQFSPDENYPMHDTTRSIARAIRSNEDYFSDSIVDDLVDILHHLLHADADSDTCTQCADETR